MRKQVLAATALMLLLAPSTVRADGLLTPFAGIAFGGDTNGSKATYGLAFGFMVNGKYGVESDFDYTPDFFGKDTVNVRAMMVSALVGFPLGDETNAEHGPSIRPYGAIGLGAMNTPRDNRKLGFNAGGGVMVFLNDTIGVRGDFRYYRTVSESDPATTVGFQGGTFSFMRVVGGLILRF